MSDLITKRITKPKVSSSTITISLPDKYIEALDAFNENRFAKSRGDKIQVIMDKVFPELIK